MSSPVAIEYISVGGNRQSAAADWSARSGSVAYGADQVVALWKPLSDHGVTQVLKGHKSKVTAVKFVTSEGRDDELLVSGSEDGELRIWKKARNQNRYEQEVVAIAEKAHDGSINVIAVQPKEQIFLTGGADYCVKLWRISGDKLIHLAVHLLKPRLIPLAVDVAPCGSVRGQDELLFAVAGTRNDIQVLVGRGWDSQNVKIQQHAILTGHEGWIRSLSFTTYTGSKDLLLASASHDKYVRLWLFREGTSTETERARVKDNSMLEQTLTAKVHKVSLNRSEYSITFEALLLGHEDWVYSASWSTRQTNPQLLTASADGSLSIWEADASSGVWLSTHRLGEISGQKGATTATGSSGGFWTGLWSPDGQAVTCLGRTGGWRVWKQASDTQFWQPRTGVGGHTAAVNGMSWSLDSAYLLSTSSDQTTRLHAEWLRGDKQSWHEFARPQIHGYDLNCVTSTKPYQFVSGADEKLLRVFDEPKSLAQMLSRLCHIDLTDSKDLPETAAIPVLGLSNKVLDESQDVNVEGPENTNGNFETAPPFTNPTSEISEPPTEDILARHTLWPEKEKLYGHGYEISEAASSPDGSLLATACKASSVDYAVIRLYDTTTWHEIKPPLSAHNLTVTRLVFSPQPSQYLLSVSRDRQWAVFEKTEKGPQSWELLQLKTKAHTRMILDAAWCTSSKYMIFATAGRDRTIKIWSRSKQEKSTSFVLQHTLTRKSPVTAVSMIDVRDSDTMCIAAGEEDGTLSLHFSKLNEAGTQDFTSVDMPEDTFASGSINRLAWRVHGSSLRQEGADQLAVASSDGTVKILRVCLEDYVRGASETG